MRTTELHGFCIVVCISGYTTALSVVFLNGDILNIGKGFWADVVCDLVFCTSFTSKTPLCFVEATENGQLNEAAMLEEVRFGFGFVSRL